MTHVTIQSTDVTQISQQQAQLLRDAVEAYRAEANRDRRRWRREVNRLIEERGEGQPRSMAEMRAHDACCDAQGREAEAEDLLRKIHHRTEGGMAWLFTDE